jgi:hypothetical protein
MPRHRPPRLFLGGIAWWGVGPDDVDKGKRYVSVMNWSSHLLAPPNNSRPSTVLYSTEES